VNLRTQACRYAYRQTDGLPLYFRCTPLASGQILGDSDDRITLCIHADDVCVRSTLLLLLLMLLATSRGFPLRTGSDRTKERKANGTFVVVCLLQRWAFLDTSALKMGGAESYLCRGGSADNVDPLVVAAAVLYALLIGKSRT